MDRAGDHGIDRTIAERLWSTHRRYKLNVHIKAFVFEKAKFVSGQHRKAGIAYEIDGCDAHLDGSHDDVPISVEYGEANTASQGYITIGISE